MPARILVLSVTPVLFAPGTVGAEIEFLTRELPWAVVHRAYAPEPLAVSMTGRCPGGGVGFSVVSGQLPPGIALSSQGYFSGIPSRVGNYSFVIRAVNGCSWVARRFSLTVADPPTLALEPTKVTLAWRSSDSSPPMAVVRISSSWPHLKYRLRTAGDWLRAMPEHGFAVAQGRSLAMDVIVLRVLGAGLDRGRYVATVEVSAWEAEPVQLPIELTVE